DDVLRRLDRLARVRRPPDAVMAVSAIHPDTPWFHVFFLSAEEHEQNAAKMGLGPVHAGHGAVIMDCKGCRHMDVMCMQGVITTVDYTKLAHTAEAIRREHLRCELDSRLGSAYGLAPGVYPTARRGH